MTNSKHNIQKGYKGFPHQFQKRQGLSYNERAYMEQESHEV